MPERRQSVVQPWVDELPFMQQTVLFSCIRGPDGIAKDHPCKALVRWLRRCVLRCALTGGAFSSAWERGGGEFMAPWPRGTTAEQAFLDYMRSVDSLPHHFHMHVVHAAEILGYKHPVADTRTFWSIAYSKFAKDLHVTPETEEELDIRLSY